MTVDETVEKFIEIVKPALEALSKLRKEANLSEEEEAEVLVKMDLVMGPFCEKTFGGS